MKDSAIFGDVNGRSTEVDQMKRERDEAITHTNRLEAALYAMIDCFDGAVANHDSRSKGGQHVSYHGDFASMPPSSVGQMRRWSRDLRAAIAGTWPMTRAEYAAAYPATTDAALDELFTRRTP